MRSGESGEEGGTHPWRQSHGSLTWLNSKLEIVNTISTFTKISAIRINNKTNLSKLANVHEYKLATYWQKFTKIYFALVKIWQKSFFSGATFLTHIVHVYRRSHPSSNDRPGYAYVIGVVHYLVKCSTTGSDAVYLQQAYPLGRKQLTKAESIRVRFRAVKT